jgi:hypothetical protein
MKRHGNWLVCGDERINLDNVTKAGPAYDRSPPYGAVDGRLEVFTTAGSSQDDWPAFTIAGTLAEWDREVLGIYVPSAPVVTADKDALIASLMAERAAGAYCDERLAGHAPPGWTYHDETADHVAQWLYRAPGFAGWLHLEDERCSVWSTEEEQEVWSESLNEDRAIFALMARCSAWIDAQVAAAEALAS